MSSMATSSGTRVAGSSSTTSTASGAAVSTNSASSSVSPAGDLFAGIGLVLAVAVGVANAILS